MIFFSDEGSLLHVLQTANKKADLLAKNEVLSLEFGFLLCNFLLPCFVARLYLMLFCCKFVCMLFLNLSSSFVVIASLYGI